MRYAIWNELMAVDVEEVLSPRDSEEVVQIVERARAQGKHLKAVGSGHSFSDLSLGEDLLVDLHRLDELVEVDLERRLVRAQAGMSLHALVQALEPMGLALANLAEWTEQTIAGALSTATHGTSGRYRKTLVESLEELTLVDGRGRVRVLRGEELQWLTLGFFGIITEVVLRVEPLFYLHRTSEVTGDAEAVASIPELLAQHDFVDLRWVGRVPGIMVRYQDIVDGPPSPHDLGMVRREHARLTALHDLVGVLRTSALPERWGRGLFRLLGRMYVAQSKIPPHVAVYHQGLTFNSERLAPHEQRELALPMERASDCLLAVRQEMLADPSSGSIEVHVRFSPAVDVRMAPHGGRETCWLHLNAFEPSSSAALVERLSQLALEHGGRPHWGKIIPARMPRLAPLYGELALEWEQRRRCYDPDGLFLNDWYHRHLGYAPRSWPEQDERDG